MPDAAKHPPRTRRSIRPALIVVDHDARLRPDSPRPELLHPSFNGRKRVTPTPRRIGPGVPGSTQLRLQISPLRAGQMTLSKRNVTSTGVKNDNRFLLLEASSEIRGRNER